MAVEDADVVVLVAERVADGEEDLGADAIAGTVTPARRDLQALGLCHCKRNSRNACFTDPFI